MDNRKSDILHCQNDVFDKLHYASTLVNMTKTYCLEREFSGQYYGLQKENLKKLSDERNEYVAMLDLISDKLSDIFNINLNIEEKLSLQKNPDNCCR